MSLASGDRGLFREKDAHVYSLNTNRITKRKKRKGEGPGPCTYVGTSAEAWAFELVHSPVLPLSGGEETPE